MKTTTLLLTCASAVLLLAGPSTTAPAGKKVEPTPMDIEDGVLDEIHLKVETIPAGVPVVIRPFSTENTDLGTGAEGGKEKRVEAARLVVKVAPEVLAQKAAVTLREAGVYKDVLTDPAAETPGEALVVEGRFTAIDPGNRAKRYWVGFGAGASGVSVEGTVKDASGKLLAEFKHRKASGIGIGGGDYFKFLTDDVKDVGEDIAKFLSAWGGGKPLK